MDPKEVKIPLILLMIGAFVFFCYGFIQGGASEALSVLASKGSELLICMASAIVACFFVGWLMGIDFGRKHTAILKFAAIFVFPWAVALVPLVGWLIAFIIYLMLLEKLFDLDAPEVFACALMIFMARLYAYILRIIF